MTPEMSSTMQAWAAVAQAVFSVAAIRYATKIAKRQHEQNNELVEKERERIEQQDRKRDQAVLGVATNAIAISSKAFDVMHEAHIRTKTLLREQADQRQVAEAAEDLQISLRGLHAAASVVISQFEELKPVYQGAGAEAAIFHFHTLASLKDIARVSHFLVGRFDRWTYHVVENEIEPSLQDIQSFHLDITQDLSRLYAGDSHRPAARLLAGATGLG
ncbi:hypothetical protein [Xanthomonas campestris]|uniref:hypothetical protein n=1 Tax=Xanthomonas campestris TaxID=339 RepID=UPI001E43670D|nr:hypothetical protein [Xanthomonas campestris]MCC8686216.1 hypothetical protein [Xanthomonas campestris]MCW2000147.1 hypothetical protein [Xanthomonas campestris]MEA9679762.1 hypothetical protein [Xanthomonas campestris pv. raphani]MEA9699146.1 hypothetical protein [Xanthomonas campestris pv. raphani]MEA9780634.1 hypothetical protein [Xanthomonas campestris pv. raphani]